MPMLLLALVLAQSDVVSAEPPPAPPAAPPPARLGVMVGIGFSHWYGGTFGAPVGFSTPGLNVALRPKLRWLELTAAYTLSYRDLPLPNGERGIVGFASFGASLLKELRFDGQRLALAGGPQGGFVHTPRGVGGALGARVKAHYLIEAGPTFAFGPAFEARATLYSLPGSGTPLYRLDGSGLTAGHSDVQVDLSVAFAWL